jgi:murein DD-endopeptidase MepM/ murein hydrolase activator NlpD
MGEPVLATQSGIVTSAVEGHNGGFGTTVDVEHAGGYMSKYSHMSSISVQVGDSVLQGMPVGTVGSTGTSTGPHLHLEIHHDGVPIDPEPLVFDQELLDV